MLHGPNIGQPNRISKIGLFHTSLCIYVSFHLRTDAIFLLGDFTTNFSHFYLILELIYTLFTTFMDDLYNNYCA